MGLDSFAGPILPIDFFPDCERVSKDTGCQGQSRRVNENEIHVMALILEVATAQKEYGITFSGVWGYGKLWFQELDEAIFGPIGLHFGADIPRAYFSRHLGHIADKTREIRKDGVLLLAATLGPIIGLTQDAIYKAYQNFFENQPTKFKLPPREIEKDGKITREVRYLFAPYRPSVPDVTSPSSPLPHPPLPLAARPRQPQFYRFPSRTPSPLPPPTPPSPPWRPDDWKEENWGDYLTSDGVVPRTSLVRWKRR